MAVFNYTVLAPTNSAYTINGNANPQLTLQAGNTYNFIVNAPGNEFWIKTDRVIGSDARYDLGVTNNGAEVGTVTIEIPPDVTPPKLFYQSGKHISMGGALTKFQIPAESISNIVVDQLPDFIRGDHPKFQLFMEAYYEWMNQPGNPWNEAKRLNDYQDIDRTVDDFLLHLEKEYVALIPKNFDGDVRTLMKNIKDFYVTKGSPKSYEFLFNILFNETIEFYYPKRDILRSSDGKWVSETTIKITNPEQYDVFELTGQIIKQEEYYFDDDEQRYMYRDKAQATVERAVQFFLGGDLVTELYLSKVTGNFTSATTLIDNTDTAAFQALPETAKIYWFDSLGNKHEYKVEPLTTGVVVTDPGSNYDADDVLPVIAQSGDTGVNAIAQIKSVLSAPLDSISIVNGGTNWKVGDIVVFNNTGTSGTGAQGFVSAVDNSGTVPNAGAITGVRLVNGGFGYKKLPQITVRAIDPSGERQGLNTPTQPTLVGVGQNIGGVKEVQIINFGALFYQDPIIDFTTQGNGDATGTSVRGALARYPGSFSNDDGHLSAAKYLQDNKFYQEFSYVIRTGLSINAYRDTIKTLVHPAGMELFGEVFISSKVETGLYNNGADDVNDKVLNGGIEVPRYIKMLQLFQSEFTQSYLDNYIIEVDGIKTAKPQNIDRHFHKLKITDKLGEDTKAVAASLGDYIRADLSWTDMYGVASTENRLFKIESYVEGDTITGTLSDGTLVTLSHTATEYADNPSDTSDNQSILYEDFSGTYDRDFNDQDGTYTATVTVELRYRNDAVGLLPKLQFPKQEVGNVRIDMGPIQWVSTEQPGTINMQPIIHQNTYVDSALTRAGFLGAANIDFLSEVPLPSKTTYTFLGVINKYLVQDGLKEEEEHAALRGLDEYSVHKPHREPFGVQIANITGAIIEDIEDLDYRQFAGFTGTRPVKKEKIRHTKVFKLTTGIKGVESTGSRIIDNVISGVEVDVAKTVVLQPYAGQRRPINDVLFTGYKYFDGTIGETLDREIVEYFGRDIVPNKQVGANGGPSYGQVSLQTFVDLGLNIQDFLDHEFGISEYYVYGANWQRTVELDLAPVHIDNSALETTDVTIIPIKVSVSAIETVTQAKQNNYIVPVSIPKVVDNAFYSGNTNFGMQINMFDDYTIEEIESGIIRGYFTTVNPKPTVVYTRDNQDAITGTY
jgi:hypothetical protein